MEEVKGVAATGDYEKAEGSEEEEESKLEYPEECKVLDIMKGKYYDAIQFFNDTEDKKQLELAVKEYQKFSYLYEKMSKYLEFDPEDIEEDIYQRLNEEEKELLSDPKIVQAINVLRHRKAAKILEDEDVNILNFQMFQYSLKLFHKEKKRKLKEEEARKAKENPVEAAK